MTKILLFIIKLYGLTIIQLIQVGIGGKKIIVFVLIFYLKLVNDENNT